MKIKPEFDKEIEQNEKQQENQSVNGRIHFKSCHKLTLKQKGCGTLYATAQTFQTKYTFIQTRDHVLFHPLKI